MKFYTVILHFINIDENLFTQGQAKMAVEIQADDIDTAHHMGRHLQKIYGADSFEV